MQTILIGEEKQPLLILDDFASNLGALVAEAQSKIFAADGSFYSGIRARADFSYLNERGALLVKIFKDIFNCSVGIKVTESNYSFVTTPENELVPIQSLPHFDGPNPQNFAILHYLCGPEHGGTAFYRHVSTGFEAITEDRYHAYELAKQSEAKMDGTPRGYFRGSQRFEKIYEIEPRFNRLVIYRGILLHSGIMPENSALSKDFKSGRLTLNVFAEEI